MALQKMKMKGIIEPVTHSEWASPIVPILKEDGTVRICGDYKRTLHQVCLVNQYLLPRIDEMFMTTAGGQKITKIDLSQAYLQLTLDEESKGITTINTQWDYSNLEECLLELSRSQLFFNELLRTR